MQGRHHVTGNPIYVWLGWKFARALHMDVGQIYLYWLHDYLDECSEKVIQLSADPGGKRVGPAVARVFGFASPGGRGGALHDLWQDEQDIQLAREVLGRVGTATEPRPLRAPGGREVWKKKPRKRDMKLEDALTDVAGEYEVSADTVRTAYRCWGDFLREDPAVLWALRLAYKGKKQRTS